MDEFDEADACFMAHVDGLFVYEFNEYEAAIFDRLVRRGLMCPNYGNVLGGLLGLAKASITDLGRAAIASGQLR